MNTFRILLTIVLLSFYVNAQGTVCKEGEYKDVNGKCKPCISDCKVCEKANQCTTCKDGFTKGTTTYTINGVETKEDTCIDNSIFAALFVWLFSTVGIIFLIVCSPCILICCIGMCFCCFTMCAARGGKKETTVYYQPETAAPNYYA